MGNSHKKTHRGSKTKGDEMKRFEVALHSFEVNNCDLHILRPLLKLGMSLNMSDEKGRTPLHLSVLKNRPKVLKYLLRKKDIEINVVDCDGHSALLLALMHDIPDCATELIKQGADINLANNKGYTPLHYAVLYSTNKIIQLLLESGPDLNAQNIEGETALHLACERCCDPEKILMLLYYGADVLVACKQGMIPLFLVIENEYLPPYTRKILYLYTVDDMAVMNLKTVVKAMISDSLLFTIILRKVRDVTYDKSDLVYLNEHLLYIQAKSFKIFLEKFDHVVTDLLSTCNTLTRYLLDLECIRRVTPNHISFFHILMESKLAFEAVQSCCPTISVIASLTKIFHKNHLPLLDLTELVCCLLSYGLNVTPTDMNAIYIYYGRCELFNLMLHMDVEKTELFNCDCCLICDYELIQESIMGRLFYDVDFTVEKFLEKPTWFLSLDLDVLLDFFALPELKNFFLSDCFKDHVVQDKVLKMPTVPYLVELARNAARRFIIKHFELRNSSHFYTVIKCLPLADEHKKILCYEKQLYNIL